MHPATQQPARWVADLLWASTQSHALDIAVLRIRENIDMAHPSGSKPQVTTLAGVGAMPVRLPGLDDALKESVSGASAHVASGTKVMIVGHGLHGNASSLPPSATFGCVSAVRSLRERPTESRRQRHHMPNRAVAQVNTRQDCRASISADVKGQPTHVAGAARDVKHARHLQAQQPAVLITDAAVHPGCSGGGMFACGVRAQRAVTPTLLGLVTSNARLSSGLAVPSIGWVLPVAQFAHVVRACQDDVNADTLAEKLQRCDVAQPALDALWGVAMNTRTSKL